MQLPKLCLMSPVSSRNGTNHMIWVGLDDPILVSSHPLNEIIIERSGIPVWSKLASSNQLIDQPISWPIAPLRPGERVTLKTQACQCKWYELCRVLPNCINGKTPDHH